MPLTEYKREYYFVCDLGPRGRGRMTQTKLFFMKTTSVMKATPKITLGQKDTEIDVLELSTSSEGQQGTVCGQSDGLELMKD